MKNGEAFKWFDYIVSSMVALDKERGLKAKDTSRGTVSYAIQKLRCFLAHMDDFEDLNDFEQQLLKDIADDPEAEYSG